MSRHKTIIIALLIALAAGFSGSENYNSESGLADATKPNIILLFADDLGYGDLSCFGHPYAKTPNLDQLATEGTMFMKFNVTGKTCHPSRCGILTSRVPSSYPIPSVDFGFNQAKHGYVDRVTIMELMKGEGYTTGHVGKWHIGPENEIAPGIYGLDYYEILGGGGRHELGRDQRIYDRAIAFIEENKDQPFYLNVMGRVTHSPVAPRPELIEMAGFGVVNEEQQLEVEPFVIREDFMGTQIQDNFDIVESANDPENVAAAEAAGIIGDINYSMANYLTEVYFLDSFIGKLLDKLDELGIADNTIVMFASDQGPAPVQFDTKDPEKINLVGYSGGFRGQKHDEYEGGIRVSCILRWPGHIPAGKVNTESTWSSLDWLPTLCKITGVDIDSSLFHGEDVLDIWLGSDRSRNHPQFWSSAMKVIDDEGEWRIYFGAGEDPPVEELYNLRSDLMETENLLDTRSDKAEEFRSMWVNWLRTFDYDSLSTTPVSSYALNSREAEVLIYPNPAKSFLQVDLDPTQDGRIHIYDGRGRLVLAQLISENSVNISGLRPGGYFVRVSTEKGTSYYQKIMKE
jgi:N-acetylgalactosamine-6-sulfatase